MPAHGLDYRQAVKAFFLEPRRFFEHGGEMIRETVGERNEEGLGLAFAANVFGHYCLVSMI